jgi:hypothetical protein
VERKQKKRKRQKDRTEWGFSVMLVRGRDNFYVFLLCMSVFMFLAFTEGQNYWVTPNE